MAKNVPEEAEQKAALNKSLKAQVAAFEAAKGDLLPRTDQLLAILETLRQELRLREEHRAHDFDYHWDYSWIWGDIVRRQYLPDLNRRIVLCELEEPGSTAAVRELRLVKTAREAAGGYQGRPDAPDLEGDLRVIRRWLLSAEAGAAAVIGETEQSAPKLSAKDARVSKLFDDDELRSLTNPELIERHKAELKKIYKQDLSGEAKRASLRRIRIARGLPLSSCVLKKPSQT